MIASRAASIVVVIGLLSPTAYAQDVPGIEICTVDKTMERRTSCLQSNVEFLVKTINKMRTDHEQRMAGAAREIAGLKATTADLQKAVADLQAAKAKESEPAKPALAAPTPAPSMKPSDAGKP